MDLSIGQTIELEIEKMVYGGDGLGHWNNIAVFVSDVAVGDVIEGEITKVKKNFARAKILSILYKSSIRTKPKCKFFEQGCGGCQWMHIDYSQQLNIKEQIIKETSKRSKLDNIRIHPVLGMDEPYHFRNKATAKCYVSGHNSLKLGFYAKKSHNVINVFGDTYGACTAQSQINNRILKEIGNVLSKHTKFAEKISDVAIRSADMQAVIDLPRFVISKIPSENLVHKHLNICLRDKTFRVFGASFFQTNIAQTEKLLAVVEGHLEDTESKTLVDIFSGVGLFGISFANRFAEVIGVESSASAIRDANFNIKSNGIGNIRYIHGNAEEEFAKLGIKHQEITVILDPPREGCHKKLLQQIAKSSAKEIIYISCDLATLYRDLRILDGLGYKTLEIQPIDMFPHTYHIECVAKIVKGD